MSKQKRAPGIWQAEDLERGNWFSVQAVADGYEWLDGEGGPFLVEVEGRGVIGTARGARLYSPLVKTPVMHRELWHLYQRYALRPPTRRQALQNAIVTFANRYGQLGTRQFIPPPGGKGLLAAGETLDHWCDAIRDVGRLVSLWDLIRGRRVGLLGKQIAWLPKGDPNRVVWQVVDQWGKRWVTIALRGHLPRSAPQLFDEWRLGDVLPPAEFTLASVLNEHLVGSVSPQLMPLRTRSAAEHSGHMVGRLVPHLLLNVAYTQLYFEITGQHHYQPCQAPDCGRWMDTTGGRADRRYCGAACRKRAQRARQRAVHHHDQRTPRIPRTQRTASDPVGRTLVRRASD